MASPEDENLKVFYRAMTTEELITYRSTVRAKLQEAKDARARTLRRFYEHRQRLVAEVLLERGVEALN